MMTIVQRLIGFGSADWLRKLRGRGRRNRWKRRRLTYPAHDVIGEANAWRAAAALPPRGGRVHDAVDRAVREFARGLLAVRPVLESASPSYISTCRLRMSGLGIGPFPTNG